MCIHQSFSSRIVNDADHDLHLRSVKREIIDFQVLDSHCAWRKWRLQSVLKRPLASGSPVLEPSLCSSLLIVSHWSVCIIRVLESFDAVLCLFSPAVTPESWSCNIEINISSELENCPRFASFLFPLSSFILSRHIISFEPPRITQGLHCCGYHCGSDLLFHPLCSLSWRWRNSLSRLWRYGLPLLTKRRETTLPIKSNISTNPISEVWFLAGPIRPGL